MAREWRKRLGRPGRAALSARWANVRLQGKGLLLGLRSALARLMKLGVALAQPVQGRFDPHNSLDAEADLLPFVRAKPLNQACRRSGNGGAGNEVPQVMCDIRSGLTSVSVEAVAAHFGWR